MNSLIKSLGQVLTSCVFILLTACAQASNTYTQKYVAEPAAHTDAELAQILAPIALYPDSLLSHVLIASTYPLEVIQAQRWSAMNGYPEGNAALDLADGEDWDSSVIALTAFPDLLQRMSDDLGWTQSLGEAFLSNEEQVLVTIQDLRSRARDTGSLSGFEHLEVINDDSNNIVIESRVKEVVYVPYYDTRVVYGPWWWSAHPPVYWHSGVTFHWGPRIYVGTGIYFSSFHWPRRHVVVIDRHRYGRFHSSRHVVRHAHSYRWEHNAHHRRGVYYRDRGLRQRYDVNHRRDRDIHRERRLVRNSDSRERTIDGRVTRHREIESRVAVRTQDGMRNLGQRNRDIQQVNRQRFLPERGNERRYSEPNRSDARRDVGGTNLLRAVRPQRQSNVDSRANFNRRSNSLESSSKRPTRATQIKRSKKYSDSNQRLSRSSKGVRQR